MLKYSLPAPLQQLPVTPVPVLSASAMGGCVAPTPGEPGFSAGTSWDPATVLAAPCPLSCLSGPAKCSV